MEHLAVHKAEVTMKNRVISVQQVLIQLCLVDKLDGRPVIYLCGVLNSGSVNEKLESKFKVPEEEEKKTTVYKLRRTTGNECVQNTLYQKTHTHKLSFHAVD